MVERQRIGVANRYPRAVSRVVPRPGRAGASGHEVGDRCRRLPRVATGSGVHSDNPAGTGAEPGLFSQLAYDGLFHGLRQLDKTSRESPGTSKRRTSAADQKDPAAIDPDGVGRKRRPRVVSCHAAASGNILMSSRPRTPRHDVRGPAPPECYPAYEAA